MCKLLLKNLILPLASPHVQCFFLSISGHTQVVASCSSLDMEVVNLAPLSYRRGYQMAVLILAH